MRRIVMLVQPYVVAGLAQSILDSSSSPKKHSRSQNRGKYKNMFFYKKDIFVAEWILLNYGI